MIAYWFNRAFELLTVVVAVTLTMALPLGVFLARHSAAEALLVAVLGVGVVAIARLTRWGIFRQGQEDLGERERRISGHLGPGTYARLRSKVPPGLAVPAAGVIVAQLVPGAVKLFWCGSAPSPVLLLDAHLVDSGEAITAIGRRIAFETADHGRIELIASSERLTTSARRRVAEFMLSIADEGAGPDSEGSRS